MDSTQRIRLCTLIAGIAIVALDIAVAAWSAGAFASTGATPCEPAETLTLASNERYVGSVIGSIVYVGPVSVWSRG